MNKSETHAVVDIESLGDKAGSIVLSIGAVAIQPFSDGETDDDKFRGPFTVNICPQSCADVGLTITGGTVDWWMARNGKGWPVENRVTLKKALTKFSTWYQKHGCKHFWSHATFDPALLEAAYKACKMPVPWDRWAPKDLRTLKHLLEVMDRDVAKYDPEEEHVALHDATAEACWVVDALKAVYK